MIALHLGPRARNVRSVDLPYSVRIYGVTEQKFDELVDEDTKAELIDGVMIVHSPASPRHNQIAGFLRKLLSCYVEETGRGEVFGPDDLVHLATCRRFAPDGFFLRDVPKPLPAQQFEGAPDLVIEVLAASNRDEDLKDKRPAYREAGVQEIWLVDPAAEEVILDRRRKGVYTTRRFSTGKIPSRVVEGFWVESEWLWAEPMPKVGACLRKLLASRG